MKFKFIIYVFLSLIITNSVQAKCYWLGLLDGVIKDFRKTVSDKENGYIWTEDATKDIGTYSWIIEDYFQYGTLAYGGNC